MRAIDGDRLKRKAQKVATEAWKMKIKANVEVILNEFIDWINDAPTIEPEPHWIPCSERLPEQPNPNPEFEGKPLDIYLVCKQDNIPFRAFWNGRNFADGWTSLDVDAWMPLPEAYREGES